MKSYYFWTSQANRWADCVDFGSPVSAWSSAMHKEYNQAKEEGRRPSMANVRDKSNS